MSHHHWSPHHLTSLLLATTIATLSLVSVASGAGAVAPASPNWFQVGTPTNAPTPRNNASMVYDGATGTTVLFGGYDGSYLADTWSWNGSAWTKLSPVTSPTPRQGAAIAYDATNHDVVLFGGTGSGGRLGDTWTWSGTTWTLLAATGPSARSESAMSYDALTHNVVLFGGKASSGAMFDTWLWNGASWSSPTVTTSPAARSNESLAYDGTTRNVVLFGGQGTSAALGDTWTWDGSAWMKQTAASPPARYGAPMIYDVATGNLVLFGGNDGSTSQSDTWIWNGTYWNAQVTNASPSARYQASLVYDTTANNAVLFAGTNGTANDADTWAFVVAPGAPRNVKATSNNAASSVVTWSAPLYSGGSPITAYVVTASDSTTASNGGQSCSTIGATMCTVTGLTNGDHYVLSVTALSALGAGASAPSPVAIPATVPGTPTLTKVVAGDRSATLTWSAPTSTGGTPIASYRVVASPGGAFCHVAAAVTSCVISGLRNGSRYSFTLSASNAVGTGPTSLPSAAIKIRTVPGAPFITSVRVINGKINLAWRWPHSNGGSRILGYEVYVGPVPGGEATSPLNARLDRKLTYSFRGRKGYSIFIYVRAKNAAGIGAHSNQVTAYTK